MPKHIFDRARVEEVQRRVASLRAESERQWGKMNAPQALRHCSLGVEMALGEVRPPRMLIGRVIGGFVKRLVLRNDDPLRRNAPTAAELMVSTEQDLALEQKRLLGLVERFVQAGPTGCTAHPHAFFGRLTGAEWGILMYKHLDHHLRQFGA